jgi:glycolate oxidase iron-sulfur subunit
MNTTELVDYTRSLDCVHCGLCLRTCPTYQATGRESSSPRGRIHLMRALAEGTAQLDSILIDELDYCLMCRNCESVCPSGVEYAHLLAYTRDGLANDTRRSWTSRTLLRIGLRVILPSRFWIGLQVNAMRLAQRSGLFRLFGARLGAIGRAMSSFPEVPPRTDRRPLPAYSPAEGERKATVAILEGCVMPALFGRVNRATVHVLQAAGRDVHVPRDSTCCGALHAHNGDLHTARDLARAMIADFEGVREEGGEPTRVVVNSAGCAAQMKEYGQLLADDPAWRKRAEKFSARVRDFNEYLAEEALEDLLPRLGKPVNVPTPLTFDDPCHLCHGQGVRSQPRTLLDSLAVERVEIAESESCCGSAGLYSALRPSDSKEILAPRLEALKACGARTLVTANPGCQLQWESGVQASEMEVEVLHVAEVLERALPHHVGPTQADDAPR